MTLMVEQQDAERLANDRRIAREALKPAPNYGRISSGIVLGILVVLGINAYLSAGIGFGTIIDEWPHAVRVVSKMWPLDFPPIGELLWLSALTLAIVICGTLLAALLSLPVAILAAGNTSPGPIVRAVGRFIGVAARATPDVVLVMILGMVLGGGSFAGILALGLHSVGMISKLFADAIEQIDEGPRLALRAAGATKSQEFWSGIFPQVLPSFVATTLHRNDINLRVSIILGYVNVPGIGVALALSLGSLNYARTAALALTMFLLCVGMEIVSTLVRKRLLGIQSTGKLGLAGRIVESSEKLIAKRQARRQSLATVTPTSISVPSVQEFTAAGYQKTTAADRKRPWDAQRVGNLVWLSVSGLVVLASIVISMLQQNLTYLLSFWSNLQAKWRQLWPTYLNERYVDELIPRILDTINMALGAGMLTLLFSFIIGSFAAQNVAPNDTVRNIARLILIIIRGIPELILAIFFLVMFGFGTGPALLALGIGGIGLLGKLFADSLEEVNPGPERALRAAGASRVQVYFAATLPQVFPAFVGHYLYSLDTKFRSATLLGLVGAGGIGYMLAQSQTVSQHQLIYLLGCILIVVFAFELLSMWLRKQVK